jgi:hypothetical protein
MITKAAIKAQHDTPDSPWKLCQCQNSSAVDTDGVNLRLLPDRAAMRDTCNRLCGLDDGLPPIENTDLL